MEDKQSAPTNLELTKDQLETKDSCGDELQSDGDSEEKQVEGNGFVTQLGDNQSLSSEDSSKNDGLRSKIPRVNCPEHIILCLDLSAEMKSTSFQNKTVLDRTAFQLVQRAGEIFVKTKSKLNAQHMFCIVGLDDIPTFSDFTSDIATICSMLNILHPEDKLSTYEDYDMAKLFEVIQENVTLPHVEDISLPPPYVVRVIIVYGRSYCIPRMSTRGKEIFSQLSACPYFFLDVLYVHELPSETNRCKEIYDFFCDMDEEEDGFMLEVSRSTTRLFDHMAALVAHPLQRPKQRDTSYTLTLRED